MSAEPEPIILRQPRRLQLPAPLRRSLLLGVAFSVGGLLALTIPYPPVRIGDFALLLFLALLAGVSSLWSP
jgi:hypothetical protein